MTFCSRQGTDSADEVALFYLIAMEFVRYVEARHGRDALNSVVMDVGPGVRSGMPAQCGCSRADCENGLEGPVGSSMVSGLRSGSSCAGTGSPR